MDTPAQNSVQDKSVDLGGGVTMEFALIPPGSFSMGAEKRRYNEKPAHPITLTTPFYMGRCEVTQEQWKVVMGGNPSGFQGSQNPVDGVSWDDCQEFLARLNERSPGLKASLPTEAQWEYACRAGSTTTYCYGDDESQLADYAWYAANAGGSTHPVGRKKPNAWGLYDMHGNLWEWCRDWYGRYSAGAQRDPQGPRSGLSRVLRGGAFDLVAAGLASSRRSGLMPDGRHNCYGFRVALPAIGSAL